MKRRTAGPPALSPTSTTELWSKTFLTMASAKSSSLLRGAAPMSLAGAGNWFVKFDAEADGSVRSMALRRNARAFGREPTGLPRVTAIIVLSRGCGAGYMSIGTADETTGVYFRHEDYAGFWRRLMIDIIDAVVIGVVCLGAFIGLWAFVSSDVILLVCAGMAYCYFVLFKRTKTGTLGYRIGGVKIVGLDG